MQSPAGPTLYAAFLQGRLTPFLQEVFADTLEEADRVLRRFTNPESRALVKHFNETMQQLDAQILLGFKTTAARKMDTILAQAYPPEPPMQNLWQRLLGRAE